LKVRLPALISAGLSSAESGERAREKARAERKRDFMGGEGEGGGREERRGGVRSI
jgi:hypothetical protein